MQRVFWNGYTIAHMHDTCSRLQNVRKSEAELLKIKEKITEEFRVESIDSEMHRILERRIDDRLKQIREETSMTDEEDFEGDSGSRIRETYQSVNNRCIAPVRIGLDSLRC